MPLTADRLDPAIIAQIRANAERVVAKTDHGYQPGVRGRDLFTMMGCMGYITLTDEGEVYHSMVGSVPVFNREELDVEITRARVEVNALNAASEMMIR